MVYCSLGEAFPTSQAPPKWISTPTEQDTPKLKDTNNEDDSDRCRYLEYLYLKHLQEKYHDPGHGRIEGFSLDTLPDGLQNLILLILLGAAGLILLDFSLKLIQH